MRISTSNEGSVKKIAGVAGIGRTTPAWSPYCHYWNVHYPNMKVRKNFVPQGGKRLEALRSLQIEKVFAMGFLATNKC
jgi:hypothetical protein